jgi:hypothetical protein
MCFALLRSDDDLPVRVSDYLAAARPQARGVYCAVGTSRSLLLTVHLTIPATG